MLLLLTPPSLFPRCYASLPPLRLHLYTAVQLAVLAVCWAVNLSPLGICVSFVIVLLVPFRAHVLPRLFSAHELSVLDPLAVLDPNDLPEVPE